MTNKNMFQFALNTSTIKGQNLNLEEEIRITAQAGYNGIEIWESEIDAFVSSGKSLSSLKNLLQENNLKVPNIIAFFTWGVDDTEKRAQGFDGAKKVMEKAAALNCTMVAASPMGLVNVKTSDYNHIIDYYSQLLEIGASYQVVPVLEFWGMSETLGRIGEALLVISECGHSSACILADIFHMYKKGTPHSSLSLLSNKALGLVHMNDYPSSISRQEITDSDRIYPGDGAAPMKKIMQDLYSIGYSGTLSLELFNKEFWKQDPALVAKTGLRKMQNCVDMIELKS